MLYSTTRDEALLRYEMDGGLRENVNFSPSLLLSTNIAVREHLFGHPFVIYYCMFVRIRLVSSTTANIVRNVELFDAPASMETPLHLPQEQFYGQLIRL